MPTYEYTCKDCGQHLEVVQSFMDDALTVCPSCAGPLRKVFGNIGIAFKGSGFYKTDSRSDRKGGQKRAEAKAADTTPGTAAGTPKSGEAASSAAASSAPAPSTSAPATSPTRSTSGAVAAAS
jgi:putative FmdB family regulatory protein